MTEQNIFHCLKQMHIGVITGLMIANNIGPQEIKKKIEIIEK